MKLADAPRGVLVCLMALDDRADRLARAADDAEQGLRHAREVLSGRQSPSGTANNFKAMSEAVARVRAGFDQQLAAAEKARRDADAAQHTASSVKAWLAMLSDGAALEPMRPDTEGQSLPSVRARLKQIQSELGALEAAPVPPADLAAYCEASVRGVAATVRLAVDYRGAGQELRWSLDGDHGAKFAFLFPQQLSALLAERIAAICAQPMPADARPARIAQLRGEKDVMQRLLATMINQDIAAGGTETHDLGTPAWAVLEVRVLNAEVARQVA
jgi:hypothetical protein